MVISDEMVVNKYLEMYKNCGWVLKVNCFFVFY